MTRLSRAAKKVVVSLSLSAGVLSIANIDTIWEERAHRHDYEVVRQTTRQRLHASLSKGATTPVADPTLERLRGHLAQDEIGTRNPFADLSTIEPLTLVLAKGVKGFGRQAYRSPQYKEETGYDLVSYEIQHADQTVSRVLAYLETPLEGGEPVPVVLVMRAGGEGARQSLYRSGQLIEETDVTLLQAQNRVHQRLNAGIPFMSVAR